MTLIEATRKAGKARVSLLTKKEHSKLARDAANARWAKHKQKNEEKY